MKKLVIATALIASTLACFAELADDRDETVSVWTPVQFSIASPIEVPHPVRNVYGLKYNMFYGHSQDVYGLDLGMVSVNRGNSTAISLNMYNDVGGCFDGIQIGGLVNHVAREFRGLQIGGFVSCNYGDSCGLSLSTINFNYGYNGILFGLINWNCDSFFNGFRVGGLNVTGGDSNGAEFGAMEYCTGNFSGFQCGAFNTVLGHMNGLQLGVVNATRSMRGVQIGVINIIETGALPIMVIANASF